jgi:hypothetical protein
MESFFAQKVLLPFDSSTLLVEAADFDRTVVFTYMTHPTLFAFDAFAVTTGASGEWTQANPADLSDRFSFTLPAGRELWAGHTADGQSAALGFLVTS